MSMSYRGPVLTALYRFIIWPCEAVLLFLAVGILQCLPASVASASMGRVFQILGPLTPWHKRALANMKFALPHLSLPERQHIAHGMWNNIGRCIGEYPHIKTMLPSGRISFTGLEKLTPYDGGFIISAHLSNWEAVGLLSIAANIKTGLIYRELNNPYANWIFKNRVQFTGADSYIKGREAAMGMVRTVKKGGFMMMVVDQQLREGEFVPFFGHPATTAISYIKVARKMGKPIFMAHGVRTKDNRLNVTISDPLTMPAGDDDQATMQIAQQINNTFEDWISAAPEQWLWPHRRWGKSVVKDNGLE
ncbi:MAG: Lipid A biosynthesis palmitoleoyltransferase [Alphaproteobacteria bacterium UBA4588]|nr:MAG: Lipid A biosynthesis palmitoleoyltransferase [Alphaproteobacteria bacterium UBA4588]